MWCSKKVFRVNGNGGAQAVIGGGASLSPRSNITVTRSNLEVFFGAENCGFVVSVESGPVHLSGIIIGYVVERGSVGL